PAPSFMIPSTRFYSHQIPAEFLFEQPRNIRLGTSASPLETAFIDPLGSAGVTAYNLFDGKRHLRTATPDLFSKIVARSRNWGVLIRRNARARRCARNADRTRRPCECD